MSTFRTNNGVEIYYEVRGEGRGTAAADAAGLDLLHEVLEEERGGACEVV